MSMTRTRAWVAGAVALSILVGVSGWFLLIGPSRAEAADLRQQTTDTRTANVALQTRLDELRIQFADLPDRQADLAEVQAAMPEDAAVPALVRDLDTLADASGVTIMSLTPGTGEVVTGADTTVGTTDPADDAATTTAAVAANGDTLVRIPVTLQAVGSFFESELFLKQVQTELTRAFLVSGLTLTAETGSEAAGGKPAVENGDVSMTITGAVFVFRAGDATVAPVPADPTSPIVTN